MREKWRVLMASERWDAIWLFVLTKGIAIGAAVPITFAWKANTTAGRVSLMVLGGIVYLVAFVLDGLVKASERSRKAHIADEVARTRTETTNAVCHAFSGIPQYTTSFLTQVQSGDPQIRSHQDRYFADVMESLTKAVPVREPRVCLYLVDRAESSDDSVENSASLLLCGNGIGRSDPPRKVFDSTTEYGRFLIERMFERKPLIIEDTDELPPHLTGVLDCTDKYYKSFVAVPVTYNDHEYGMLMIDSPQHRGITKDHQVVAHLFGRFLASGFHMVQSSPASLPGVSGPPASVEHTVGGD